MDTNARQDHRLGLEKRRAKALELIAKKNGEDHTAYTAEWKRLVELEKQAKSNCAGTASSTGRSRMVPRPSYSTFSSKRRSSSHWAAPIEVLSAPRFVAVDFETANSGSGVSACQIALIKIDMENYKLPTVTKALVPGFKLNHHEASSDAEACGLIIAALQAAYC